MKVGESMMPENRATLDEPGSSSAAKELGADESRHGALWNARLKYLKGLIALRNLNEEINELEHDMTADEPADINFYERIIPEWNSHSHYRQR